MHKVEVKALIKNENVANLVTAYYGLTGSYLRCLPKRAIDSEYASMLVGTCIISQNIRKAIKDKILAINEYQSITDKKLENPTLIL